MGNNNSSRRRKSFRLSISKNNKKQSKNKNEEINIINDVNDDISADIKLYFNGDENVHRQHDHHFLKKHLFQSEFSSPIKERIINGGKVLDLGCGPATFLLDIASNYPNCKCMGVDIEPTFPSKIKPKNLEFKIADIFQRLPFPDNEFDLVHLETMLFFILPAQLNFLISEMIRVTKPNGYIEFAETHISKCEKNSEKFGRLICGFDLVAKSSGADIDMILKLPTLLGANTNINNINVDNKSVILGSNGGKLGIVMQNTFEWFSSNETVAIDVCKQLNITREQYDQLVKDSFNELDYISPKITFYRVYAQKNNV